MRRKASLALLAVIAAASAIAGVWITFGQENEPWPPEWYISPETDRTEYAALRRRATATTEAEFPPSGAKLELLRNIAVGASPDIRPKDARVYVSAGYVLALRGRFSTEGVSRPPGIRHPFPPFAPCLTHVLDPSTFFAASSAIGPCQDLSSLGESVSLDLGEEGG